MKKTIISSFALGAMIALFACQGSSNNNNGSNADSAGAIKQEPANTNAATNSSTDTTAMAGKSAQPVDERTSTFMKDIATAGNAEVAMGNIAKEKTTNPRVKAFAEMMVKDHTSAGDDLKSIASKKSVTLPTDAGDHQKHIDDMNKETGPKFDKDYMKMMVDGHKKVVDELEKESQKGTDPDVKNFASEKLPTIRMHLDSAKAILQSLK